VNFTLRLSLFLGACAAALAPSARAQERPASEELSTAALPGPEALGGAPALFPVEVVLDQLRSALGMAFVFDSRLLAGAKIRPVDASRSPEGKLRDELRSINLDLHKVSAKTFAITHAAADEAVPDVTADNTAAPDAPIDTILVIGAAPAPSTATGSKRLFDINAEELAYLSVTSPAEAIYDLPQSLASFTSSNTALYGATAGVNLADLRGLSPKRTMVMVNGRRRTITPGGISSFGGVDLNAVAEPFLERIEVQNLPGAARYGAGAVAGVINFVTKSDFIGVDAGARLGISEKGDSEEISLHALAGFELGEAGNLSIGLNATRTEGLIGADRSFSAVPYGFGLNGHWGTPPAAAFLPGYGQSSITDRGSFGGVILSNGAFAPFPGRAAYIPGTDGTIAPFVGALDQLYNWAAWQNVVIPNDRLLGRLSYSRELGGDWRFFAEGDAGISASDNALAPLPATRARGVDPAAGDAAVIPLSNPFLPQSVRDLVASTFGPSATGVVFDHRYAELGPRRHQIDRRYIDLATGVEAGDPKTARFGLTYRFAHNRVVTRDADRIDNNRLKIALDPAQCAPTPGCSPVDYFSTPEISAAALDFIRIPEIRRTVAIEEHELAAAATRPLRFKEDFVGRVSAGVELRRAALSDDDEIPAGAAPVGYVGGADFSESMNSIEAYTEIDTPLFRSDGLPGEIDASLAVRGAKSSRFDASFNFEAGLDWRPAPGVALFTRQHVGERTPDLIELFTIGPTLETSFVDPCGRTPSKQTPVESANCASAGPLGVFPGFAQTAPLASATDFGNPNLEPERVRSGAYGVTISPTERVAAIPGKMQLTATWLDFEVKDAISEFSDVIGECFASAGFSSPACGGNPRTGAPLIVRDPATRQIAAFDSLMQNSGAFSWRGLDLEFRYAAQPAILPFADSVWLSALHTYTDRVERVYPDGAVERLDGLIDFPRHRTLASAGLDAGRWTFVAYANRRGRALTRQSDIPEARVPPALYVDATVRFDITDAAYVQASVKNITDKEPAITAFNDVGNFAPEYYDPVGRRYALSVRVNF
jgi:outer membrane receptor protein involved in Fe transport